MRELIASIALGFIGVLPGPWVAHQLYLSEPLALHVSAQPFPIVWSIIGAALLVALLPLPVPPPSVRFSKG